MTAQEIFDKVAKHLITQNARSNLLGDGVWEEGNTNSCMYRNHEGLACAVGCLIPDDHVIIRKFNTSPIESVQHNGIDIDFLLPSDFSVNGAITFLRLLQRIHDFEPIADWPSQLRAVAAAYDLVVPAFLRVK